MRQGPQNWTTKAVANRIDQVKSYVLSVGETAVDIAVSILLLVLVGRAYGPGGLGVFSFLLSVFVIVSFLVEFGVGKYVERELAVGSRKDVQNLLSEARGVVLLSGLLGGLGTPCCWASGSLARALSPRMPGRGSVCCLRRFPLTSIQVFRLLFSTAVVIMGPLLGLGS